MSTASVFDIAADLDTPVSAYLKLAPFRPRFLLESVEGGERLGRYSFIGFGDCARAAARQERPARRWTAAARPPTAPSCSTALRDALAAAPRPEASTSGFPFHGGLVGVSSYDLARYFERLPRARRVGRRRPTPRYVAPRSLLVFDHLTRRVALLHDGTGGGAHGAARARCVRALRGAPAARPAWHGAVRRAAAEPRSAAQFLATRRPRARRHIAAGDVYQLVLSVRFPGAATSTRSRPIARCASSIPRPTCTSASSATSPSSARRPRRSCGSHGRDAHAATDRRHATARRRPAPRPRARGRAARRPEGSRRARDARRSRAQRPRPRRRAGHGRVEPFRSIERYSHVMHLVSGVRGVLRPGRDAFDLFAAAFPGRHASSARRRSARWS